MDGGADSVTPEEIDAADGKPMPMGTYPAWIKPIRFYGPSDRNQ
jgi:hypothetical protein